MQRRTFFIALLASGQVSARGGHSSKSNSHAGSGTHTVQGHTTKNGTYVQPHRQTNPNNTKQDNWSSKGNVNPDTGKQGTKDPNR